jgi:CheY-like chemotaxis protein
MSSRVHASTPGTTAPQRAAPRSEPSASARRRILVIDDSLLVREAARVAFNTADFDVVLAESGEQGLALTETEQFDAILLDVVMPGLDGLAVAELLRASPRTSASPVVLLTASDSGDDEERLEQLAIAGVIAKPFDVEDLAWELATLLGWPL